MSTEPTTPARWTTCLCTDGEHAPEDRGHSTFRAESDAEIVARHTGRHVVPVAQPAEAVSA